MLQRWVPQSELVLEHDVIPFISYPYEWPFALLKRAALLQLQLHAEALDEGFTFVDSSLPTYRTSHRSRAASPAML
jgi:hypothetical protein